MILLLDLELIIYSYLELEETLVFLYFDNVKRDKVVKLYYPDLEFSTDNLEETIRNNQFYTLKYLVSKNVTLDFLSIYLAINTRNSKFIRYLVKNGPINNHILGRIAIYGDLELLKLAVSKIEPDENLIKYIIYRYKPPKNNEIYLKSSITKKSCCIIC